MGDTVVPMLSGAAELVMRIGAALLLPCIMGQDGIYLAEVAAWTGAAVLLVITYIKKERAFPKETRMEE